MLIDVLQRRAGAGLNPNSEASYWKDGDMGTPGKEGQPTYKIALFHSRSYNPQAFARGVAKSRSKNADDVSAKH